MRVAKIALLIALAAFGGLFASAGAHIWIDTHRTTSTIFETMGSGEDDAGMCGNIDLVDKPFLIQRTAAAGIFMFGTSIVLWAGASILTKDCPGSVTCHRFYLH